MKGYYSNIESETEQNESFRKVVYTGNYMQLVFMRLKPGESIGVETHGNDQFFRFESGSGQVHVDDNTYDVADGSGVIVPAGAVHDVVNTGSDDLALYTIYATPHHREGVEHASKSEADTSHEEFNGKTTE